MDNLEDESALVRLTGGVKGLFARVDWTFRKGQNWAATGSDGEAKSLLCAWLGGVVPPPQGISLVYAEEIGERVEFVSFAQQRAAARKGGFLQARYCSLVDEAGPGDTVAEFLSFNRIHDVNPFEVGRPLRRERRAYGIAFRRVVDLLNLKPLLERDFLALSNGETRRTLLARALLTEPRLLVLDDPCAGLDPERRAQIRALCATLAADGLSLFVSVRHADEIPPCVTDVMEVRRGRLVYGRPAVPPAAPSRPAASVREPCVSVSRSSCPPVVELKDIRIAFGRRKLFDRFSWTVRQGERWVLRGANGSGKTTLLSLITGDNPKAYANDVAVFGIRRETGVELAKIRRRIGMVSPELQAYTGQDAEALLDAALRRRPDLLLLDEPCLNLDARAAAALRRRVEIWLKAHPSCTAICVAHRSEDIPRGFGLTLDLGSGEEPGGGRC